VERAYARGPLPWISVALSRASGLVPWSLAEIALVGALGGVMLLGGLALSRSLAQRSPKPALDTALALAAGAAWVFLLFTGLFGLDYARPSLAFRLGWEGDGEGSLLRAAGIAVALANRTYTEAFGTEDIGTPSPPLPPLALDAQLERGYARVGDDLRLEAVFGAPRGRAKALLLSPILCRLGLSGFYFPWTGEANVNRLVPGCEQAHTIAHEKAHQRGIAREDEANFMGVLACLAADERAVRYAGAFFAENDLLAELARRKAPELPDLLARRGRGVVRDSEDEARFWRRYRGKASELSEAVNDTYLKSQGIREGARSYEESVRLIVLFFERSGGRLR
jgi:hypothetical protein